MLERRCIHNLTPSACAEIYKRSTAYIIEKRARKKPTQNIQFVRA
uniref:Uncharacterized protein n=1 Tax=Clostridioides difficile TaxID=1496 RepID=A0A0M4HVM3_CLODI|nr:hypothetical protein [Clostridioides difficile]